MADLEQIGRRGWRQGSILGADLAGDMGNVPDDHVLIVISQECDVVHRSLATEPYVEVIEAARSAAAPDGSMTFGKNPRVLHLPWSTGRLELRIVERHLLDRALLASHSPDGDLDPNSTRTLALWVAKRYARNAFPDAFNERVRSAEKRIDKALKQRGADSSGIFVALNDWTELDAAHPYSVNLVVMYPVEVGEDEAREANLAELTMLLFEALASCPGIEVEDARHVAESEFTIHDLHSYKRWEFDFRSHSGRPGGPIAPNP